MRQRLTDKELDDLLDKSMYEAMHGSSTLSICYSNLIIAELLNKAMRNNYQDDVIIKTVLDKNQIVIDRAVQDLITF